MATPTRSKADRVRLVAIAWPASRTFRRQRNVSHCTAPVRGWTRTKLSAINASGFRGSKFNGLSISLFGIVPTLLIDKNISQSLKAASVMNLYFEGFAIKLFRRPNTGAQSRASLPLEISSRNFSSTLSRIRMLYPGALDPVAWLDSGADASGGSDLPGAWPQGSWAGKYPAPPTSGTSRVLRLHRCSATAKAK